MGGQSRFNHDPIPRINPADAPNFSGASVCLSLPKWSLPYLIGAFTPLVYPQFWTGTDEQIDIARLEAQSVLTALTLHDGCENDADAEQIEPEVITEIIARGGALESENDMGQVVTESYIDYETNELVVHYGHCCVERFPLAGFAPSGSVPSEDVTTPREPETADLACRKATGMVEALYNTVDAVMEASIYDTIPLAGWFLAKGHISKQADYQTVPFNWNYMYIATQYAVLTLGVQLAGAIAELFGSGGYALAISIAGEIVGNIDFMSEDDKQRLKCQWYKLLSSDSLEVTQDEFDAMKSALRASVNPEAWPLFEPVFLAIGRENFSWIASASQGLTDASCDCPSASQAYEDEYTTPNAEGWYLSAPMSTLTITSTGDSGWTETLREHTAEQDIYGVVFEVRRDSGPASFIQMSAKTDFGGDSDDDSLWRNTSGDLVANARYVACHSSVSLSIFGSAAYTHADGNYTWPDSVSTPKHARGETVREAYRLGWNSSGEAEIVGLRFIYNTGSPNHGAG